MFEDFMKIKAHLHTSKKISKSGEKNYVNPVTPKIIMQISQICLKNIAQMNDFSKYL